LHAKWHGFTPTDLVFPSFLFAVGNAMSFVMQKWANLSQGQVLGKVFKRTILIFLIGYLMYWFPFVHMQDGHLVMNPISHTRIMGVLQRIALCYCIASLLIYYLKPRGALTVAVFFLIAYRLVLLWFGTPGSELDMLENAGTKLDLWLFGPDHLYHGEGVAFDPEGVLSTFPAVANVVGGYLVGRFIQEYGKTYETLAKLFLAGVVLLTLAYFWNFTFPVNKKLWTSSFVFCTVGLDCVILATVIYIIDFLGKTRWTNFFQVFGKNPLFIYIVSEIGVVLLFTINIGGESAFSWIYEHIYSHAGMYLGSFLFAISFMLICWLVGWWLDKRKIYVRV
jgi:predicted acyltransferase